MTLETVMSVCGQGDGRVLRADQRVGGQETELGMASTLLD